MSSTSRTLCHYRLSLGVFLSFSAIAEDVPRMCAVEGRPEQVQSIGCTWTSTGKNGYPVWWSRPDPRPGSQDYYYSCNNLTNKRLNLSTGQVATVPGARDAVPSPDGRFLTVSGDHKSFKIYPIGVDTADATPLLDDPNMPHAYQSMATLPSSTPANTTYRVLVDDDRGGVVYKDYRANLTTNPASFNQADAAGAANPVCTTVSMRGANGAAGEQRSTVDGGTPSGFKIKLPMMSKDGSMLSAFDPVNHVTRIYRIDPQNPARCSEHINLGIPTGKAEFNYEGNKLVFHSNTQPGWDRWFRYQGGSADDGRFNTEGWNAQVFTVDLNTREMRQISTRNANSPRYGSGYYPSFRQDGSIVYMRANGSVVNNPKNGRDELVPNFEAVTISAADAAASPRLSLDRASGADCEQGSEFAALVALGMLWQDACTIHLEGRAPDAVVDSSLAMNALSLNPEACRQEVAQLWDNVERRNTLINIQETASSAMRAEARMLRARDFAGLTKADLIAACPQ